MKIFNITQKINESPNGILNSLIGKSFVMLESTTIDNLKNGNFSAYGRLFLIVDPSEILEFKTVTRLVRNSEYNITEIEKLDNLQSFDIFKKFPINQPFILKRVYVYGETVSFTHTYNDFAFDYLKDKKIEKEAIMNIDTEDIIIFESNNHKKCMLHTYQAPYFEVIFEEARIQDIIENWTYTNLGRNEKIYKLKRIVE